MNNQSGGPEHPIVVATDFSEAAVEALRQGAERARATGAKLVLMHVVHLPGPIHPLFPQLSQSDTLDEISAGKQVTRRLLALAEEHADLDPERVEAVVDFSDVPFAAIVAKAEALHARLIVLGNRGHSRLKRLLLGRVALGVVRSSHCPVLVARSHERTRRLFAPTDLSNPALLGIAQAAEDAAALGFSLTVHHNVEVPTPFWTSLGVLGPVPPQPDQTTIDEVVQAARLLLKDQLTRFSAHGETLVTAEPHTDDVILRLAEGQDAELIVLGSHGRTGIRRIALGSVAESVIRHAHCSVLAVHKR